MKPASLPFFVTCNLEAWAQLDKNLIIRQFTPLTLKNDGIQDSIIHCFKSGQPFSESALLLKDPMNILNNDDIVNCNPFEVTDSDVDEANTGTNIIDESDGEYDFMDIE